MIFINLDTEAIVQVDDMTRLDATKCFVSTGSTAISKVEIKPEATESFVDVTSSLDSDLWYLDWQYATAGAKTVTVQVTAGSVETKTFSLTVVSSATDSLWASDADLKAKDSYIQKHLPPGRNSFKHVHREAQRQMIRWLDKEGYVDSEGNPYTKAAIIDSEEVAEWATWVALRLIYKDASRAVDDEWDQKALDAKKNEIEARDRAVLRLDQDGDGTADETEYLTVRTGEIRRR